MNKLYHTYCSNTIECSYKLFKFIFNINVTYQRADTIGIMIIIKNFMFDYKYIFSFIMFNI